MALPMNWFSIGKASRNNLLALFCSFKSPRFCPVKVSGKRECAAELQNL
jgi:hypothetical protein